MIQGETCICGARIHVDYRDESREEEIKQVELRIKEWRLNHRHEVMVATVVAG